MIIIKITVLILMTTIMILIIIESTMLICRLKLFFFSKAHPRQFKWTRSNMGDSQLFYTQTPLVGEERQTFLVQLIKVAFDAEAPPNLRLLPIVDASASREKQLDQASKYLEVALIVVSGWDNGLWPPKSEFTREEWSRLCLGREQLELDMTVLKKHVDACRASALQNPEEHLEVAQMFKEVERVADHFRKVNFCLQDYKKEKEKEKADAQESAAKASGAPEAEEFEAIYIDPAPSTPILTRVHPINDEIPEQGRNAPQRANKRRKEY